MDEGMDWINRNIGNDTRIERKDGWEWIKPPSSGRALSHVAVDRWKAGRREDLNPSLLPRFKEGERGLEEMVVDPQDTDFLFKVYISSSCSSSFSLLVDGLSPSHRRTGLCVGGKLGNCVRTISAGEQCQLVNSNQWTCRFFRPFGFSGFLDGFIGFNGLVVGFDVLCYPSAGYINSTWATMTLQPSSHPRWMCLLEGRTEDGALTYENDIVHTKFIRHILEWRARVIEATNNLLTRWSRVLLSWGMVQSACHNRHPLRADSR